MEIICNINLKDFKEKIEELAKLKKELEKKYLILKYSENKKEISDISQKCCFFNKKKEDIEKRTYRIQLPQYLIVKKDNKLLIFDDNNKKYNLHINKKNNFLLIIDDDNNKLEDSELINRLNYLAY